MKSLALLIMAGMSLILSACALNSPKLDVNNPQDVIKQIKIEHDNFKKLTNFTGPNAAKNTFLLQDELFIRAWKEDITGAILFQIYIADYYKGDWRFYDHAFDSDGNSLTVQRIHREVIGCQNGCTLREHIGINVARKYLELNIEKGIQFKISGKGGEEVFFIPSGYIKGILLTIK